MEVGTQTCGLDDSLEICLNKDNKLEIPYADQTEIAIGNESNGNDLSAGMPEDIVNEVNRSSGDCKATLSDYYSSQHLASCFDNKKCSTFASRSQFNDS